MSKEKDMNVDRTKNKLAKGSQEKGYLGSEKRELKILKRAKYRKVRSTLAKDIF